MDIKTKIFWWTMGVLLVASFGATFYRYMIKKDYIVQAQVDCDPYAEACFVWNCDPESDEEGEMCTGDPEEDMWYFKVINKNASQIVSCDANDEACDALVCAQNEPDCEFVFCNPENMEENYASACIEPAKYTLENPIEEENECEEGDEECLNSEEEVCQEGDEECLAPEENEEEVSEEETDAENAENIEDADSGAEDAQPANEAESINEDISVETTAEETPMGEKVVQKNEENKGSLPVIE